jgi:flagellar hook assembly protein FlgD
MGDAEKIGKQSSLEQNVPNPFQDVTQIDYNLATNGTVRLIITNELGQPIETLVNGEKSSGQHSVRWNASNQAPGVYYYTLYFNGDLITKKMIKL